MTAYGDDKSDLAFESLSSGRTGTRGGHFAVKSCWKEKGNHGRHEKHERQQKSAGARKVTDGKLGKVIWMRVNEQCRHRSCFLCLSWFVQFPRTHARFARGWAFS